jgi:hypothetical protein
VILDANLLLCARNSSDPRHAAVRTFLEQGRERPAPRRLPWQT